MDGTEQKWYYVLRGVIALLFGIAAIVWPAVVLEFLVYFFGFFAIIISAFALIAGATSGPSGGAKWSIILLGLLGILIGILTLVSPYFFIVIIIYLIAFWALITGVGDFVAAFTASAGMGMRLLLVLLGIVSLIFGGVLLFYPLLGAATIVWVLGIYAIIFGILGIIYGFTGGSTGRAPLAA